jgi:hypothetical protein
MALRRIADTFYVTRSFDVEVVDNSRYYAALIRPTDESSVVLNTQRELLVLFADYETFEIRTLEAYKRFYQLTEWARVDQSIRFLVSGDPDVERSIRLYLEQHPEYPIIVPLTFDNLVRNNNPLISAVRQNHHIRDLFGFQSPLREEHFFFGRSQIVSGTIDLAKSGQHSSLFGLRKSGKTSTIYAIERRCKPSELHVVTFDCQDLSVHARRYGELLVHIVDRVRKSASLKILQRPDSVEGALISEWFSESMNATLNLLNSNLLLVFDEIENISPGTAASDHWRSGSDPVYFWQVIRSFAQTTKSRSVAVCIVGTSPYILEQAKINGIDNPAYLLAQKRFIPNLDFDETREMIMRLGFFMGLDFDTSAIARMHGAYGGHPFFTRQVSSKVHQITTGQRPKSVPLVRIEQAQREFSGQLESYLFDIVFNLKQYYPDEFSILRSLVLGDVKEFQEYLDEAPELIDHLLGYGLVVMRDTTAEISFAAIHKAVLQIAPDEKLETLEGKWAELCVRRGRVEQSLRTTLGIWARSMAMADWTLLLKKQLTQKRFEQLATFEPRVLFSNRSSPLYLSDLLALLGDDRVLSYLGDRRSGIRSALDSANKFRADAHAKNVTEEEYRSAQLAFDRLEAEFSVD